MKKFILISFTLIVLIVSVTLIRLPLNLIAPTINNLFPQVTYTSIEGTIWSGKIKNLSFADEFIGSFNTQFNLRNLSFLIDERGLFVEGNINLISTFIKNQASLEAINFNLNSKRFLRKVPVLSSISGKDISKLIGTISCENQKMLGSFYAVPKDDVLKGTFELDKELNYVVIANSKRLFAKISSFFESGFTSSPDVKLRGNLFDFF